MISKVELFVARSISDANLPEELVSSGADVEHFTYEVFGIGEVRELTKRASQKALGVGVRGLVVFCQSVTIEAQNALLKLFEEPPENCFICLIVPHESILISTLQSRIFTVHKVTKSGKPEDFDTFVSASYGERMNLIAARAKLKDRRWLEEMVIGLAELVDDNFESNLNSLRARMLSERYVKIRGASKKALLEELALSVPITK